MDGQSPKLRHVPVVAKLVIGAVLVVVVVGILLILIVLSYGTSEHGGIGLVIGGSVLLVFVVILFIRRKRTHQRQPKPRDDSGSAGLPQQRQHIAASQRNNVVDLVVEPSSPLYVATNPLLPLSMNQRSGSEKLIPQPEAKMDFNFSMNTFTYEQLALATEDFSDANLLGRGGFGYVHKGILPNGKIVAIKQLIVGSVQGEREFRAEVEIISRVHHKHLVSLLGYCVAGSQRMLVYEFVPNNTLDFQLHGKGHTCINWATRMKVALGSAKGLAYLHEDCQPKIIHRDIKAANILLDSNFEPKVKVYRYSDVFSFGVMLLELITGRLPSVKVQNLDLTFIDWARPLLSQAVEDGNFDTLADPRLQNNYDFMEMARMVACASVCVRHSARRRPRMSQIVRALEGIIPLEDLNDGIKPGNSTLYGSAGSANYGASQYKEDLKKFQRIAFEGQEENSSG